MTEKYAITLGHEDAEVGTAKRFSLAPRTCYKDEKRPTESVIYASEVRRGHIDESVPTPVEIDGELYNMTILTVCRLGDTPESDSISRNNTIIDEYFSGAHYLYVEHYYTKKENTGSTEATGSVASLVRPKEEPESSVEHTSEGKDTLLNEKTEKYVVRAVEPSLKHDNSDKDNT